MHSSTKPIALRRSFSTMLVPSSMRRTVPIGGECRPRSGERCQPVSAWACSPVFTPGQRRGLGVGGGEPLYTLRTRAATNAVVVGPHAALARNTVNASGRLHVPVGRAEVKVRYGSPAIAADVEPTARGFRLQLDEPAYGVARGQTAVLYEDDVVVGCRLVS